MSRANRLVRGPFPGDLTMQMEFRQGSSHLAMVPVRSDRLALRLAATPFTPAEVAPGWGVCTVVGVDYVDTDCGTYHELAIAGFVQDPRAPRPAGYRQVWGAIASGEIASHTFCLGVTTTESRDAGRDIWGFPKLLGDITIDRDAGRRRTAWSIGGRLVLALDTPEGGDAQPPVISPPVCTMLDGHPQVGFLTQYYAGVGYHPVAGHVELGSHAVAGPLRDLGLGRRALASVSHQSLHFEMSEAAPL